MALRTLVNGQYSTTLSLADRALHYGDGLFETLLVIDGQPQLWTQHMARLQSGCQRLSIPQPCGDTLYREALQLCRDQSKCVLKIIITRGSSGRGYRASNSSEPPTRILQLHTYPHYPRKNWEEGVELRVCQTPVVCHPILAGLKHLNRLENVLARSEWQDADIAEGIMTDIAGHWIEGTMSNVFLVKDGELFTPDLSMCGVHGIMRQQVIELAKQNALPCHTTEIAGDFFHEADEVFLTNSLIGIWPVKACQGKSWSTWPICTKLRQSLLC